MLIWRPSPEEDVFLEAAWPSDPSPRPESGSGTPKDRQGYFEVTVEWGQAAGTREPRPAASGRWTARYVERPADDSDELVFHDVVTGQGLVEALLACRRYADTNGRGRLPS